MKMADAFTLSTFLSTFGLIFLAEMGDKTQVVSMMLATRFDWKRAFVGIAGAFALLNVLAVFVGQIVFQVVSPGWIRLVAGLVFLFFGISTLREMNASEDDEDEGTSKAHRGPIATAFLMIFLAEMGDKTQLTTATLSAGNKAFLSVFLGSTLALWLVSILGMAVGVILAKKIPAKWIKCAAGGLFLAFGVVYLFQGATLLSWTSCPTFPLASQILCP